MMHQPLVLLALCGCLALAARPTDQEVIWTDAPPLGRGKLALRAGETHLGGAPSVGSSYLGVYPGAPQGSPATEPQLLVDDVPIDTGDAVPVPLLGPFDEPFVEEDPAAHRKSMRKCLGGLAAVFAFSAAAAAAGYFYLGRAFGREEEEEAAPAGKLPERARYAYCLPTVSTLPVTALIAVFLLSFYSQRGASLPIIAMAVAIARSFDVVSDPVMSYITDSCRHRAGRRRPFMIIGAPVYAAFLAALFNPPFLTPSMLALWFAVCYILFFLTNTFANIPYDAWGPELTQDSDERARVFYLSGLFDGGGTLWAFGLPFAGFKLAELSGLTSSICPGRAALTHQCAHGFHCADYYSGGSGHEFVENVTFTHTALKSFVGELVQYDCDLAEPVIRAGTKLEETAISTFCHCMAECAQACAGANRAWGYMLTGFFFAAWYFVTSYYCCHQVKERKPPPGGLPPSRPLVPLLLGTLQNPAFATLLPAWACDAVSTAVFLAMCPYLIQYVVAPEYQTLEDSPFGLDCKNGARGVTTSMTYDKRCNSMNVLGACVGAALCAALLTTPIWLWATRKYGKVRLWLLWSLTMAATNFLFIFLTKSWIRVAIAVCFANGVPIAAKFLADAILADIIDYDEFLTGSRNEATYTMFKSFLPKVMAIPAAALPLSVLNTAGHIPAVNGRIMYQPDAVRWAITFMAGIVSGSIAMAAWAIKRKYPLSTNEIIAGVSQGIAQHKEGKAGVDPLSGMEFSIVSFSQEENLAGVWSLDHFPGAAVVEKIRDNPTEGVQALVAKGRREFALVAIVLVLTVVGFAFSLELLTSRMFSFVPTVMAVAMGCSLVFLGFTWCRRTAAMALQASPPPPDLVLKVLQQRQALEALFKAQQSGKAALDADGEGGKAENQQM